MNNSNDLISRQAAIDAILKLTNCASVREQYEYTQAHQLADMWNGGIVDAIDAVIGVKSSHCDNCPYHSQYVPQEGAVSRKAVLQRLTDISYNHCKTEGEAEVIGLAKTMVNVMPSVQPERTCVNCGRTMNNGGWYADGRTRCPIEEHYALPKDGFCHLWEKRNVTDDDYPEMRTDE